MAFFLNTLLGLSPFSATGSQVCLAGRLPWSPTRCSRRLLPAGPWPPRAIRTSRRRGCKIASLRAFAVWSHAEDILRPVEPGFLALGGMLRSLAALIGLECLSCRFLALRFSRESTSNPLPARAMCSTDRYGLRDNQERWSPGGAQVPPDCPYERPPTPIPLINVSATHI